MIYIKKLSKVEFGLENCEVISIDGEYIGNFSVRDMKNHINKHYNGIMHMTTCDLFSIAINRNANAKLEAFDDDERMIFERLSSGDICSVDLIYDDESKDSFYVDWVGESDYKNEGQKTYVSKLGDLFIVVSKDENVDTVFKHWNIDEDGAMDMMWKFNK